MSVYVYYATSGLTTYSQISPDGSPQVYAGTVLSFFNVENWPSYANYDTEQQPQTYIGTFPTGLDEGAYRIQSYSQIGATASSTDTLLGSFVQRTPGSASTVAMPIPSAAWYAKTPFAPQTSVGTLSMAANANETLGWDFNNYPQIEKGETLASVNIACNSCTVTATTWSGGLGTARFSGAALSAVATVSVTATFSGGDSVVHTGSLSIV